MSKKVITEDQISHRFDDRYCARKDAGVVTAAAFELSFLEISVNRWLLGHDRSSRLECHPENDVFTIGDTTLDTT